MPFQISLTSGSKQLGQITSFDAGNEQFATCATEVTLTAAVTGMLNGHTVWWEQVSGNTQIVFLTPQNQLTVTYTVVGGGSSDRVFRFYIDKNTPLEQTDDVTVWGTPTETKAIKQCQLTTTTTDTECRNVPCNSIYVYYSIPTPSLQGSYATDPTDNFYLAWGVPTCTDPVPTLVSIIQNDMGSMTLVGTFDTNVITNTPITQPYDTYYAYVTFTIGSNTYTQLSCRLDNVKPPNVVSEYITDNAGVPSTVTSNTVVYYTIQRTPDSTSVSDHTTSVAVTTAATYFTLTTESSPISTSTHIVGLVNTNSVTYFSNNGIGG